MSPGDAHGVLIVRSDRLPEVGSSISRRGRSLNCPKKRRPSKNTKPASSCRLNRDVARRRAWSADRAKRSAPRGGELIAFLLALELVPRQPRNFLLCKKSLLAVNHRFTEKPRGGVKCVANSLYPNLFRIFGVWCNCALARYFFPSS